MDLDDALTIFCDDMSSDPQGWPFTVESFKELYEDYDVEGLDELTKEEFEERVRQLDFAELLG